MVRALLHKAAIPANCNEAKAYGKGLESGMAKDEFVWFFINVDKIQQENLCVTIKHEQGNYDVPFSIFSMGANLYRISYKRDTPGNYQIDATIPSSEGSSIILVSKLIKVDTDFNLAYFDLQDHFIHCFDPDRTIVTIEEHMFSFYIQTRNWRNGAIREGGLKFSADMKLVQDKSDVPIELIDLKDGNYRVNFQPTKSGRYSLDLGLTVRDGRYIRIKGSPFECFYTGNQVDVCIEPSKTEADWSKFRHRTANDLIRFLIEAVDQRGQVMHTGGACFDAKVVAPHTKEEIPIIIVDHEDGSYIGSFKPKTSGGYTINIMVKGDRGNFEHISGSPFSFYVAALELDLEPKFTLATGPGLVGGYPGKFTNFTVHPKNSKNQPILEAGVELYVKITYGAAGKELAVDIHDNLDGSYKVSYCPLVDGKHVVSVFLVDGKGKKLSISGSPFVVDIDPSIHVPYANNCHAYGMGMVSAKVGQESHFFIQARNKSRQEIPAKITDLRAYLESEDGIIFPMHLSENQDGTLTSSYTVTKPGYYTGFVMLTSDENLASEEDRYISCTPFMVEVLDKVDITKTDIRGLEKNLEFFVHQPATFRIVTKNAQGDTLMTGGESFDIKIENSRGRSVAAGIYDNCDGTYDVTFNPSQSGSHSIWVFYMGAPLAGCPQQIEVEEATDSSKSSTTRYMFVVQMRTKDGRDKDTGGDFFDVRITGSDGDVNDVQVIDVGDGSILVQYSLVKHGEYWIKAVLNNKTIHGFPFLHIVPPK